MNEIRVTGMVFNLKYTSVRYFPFELTKMKDMLEQKLFLNYVKYYSLKKHSCICSHERRLNV